MLADNKSEKSVEVLSDDSDKVASFAKTTPLRSDPQKTVFGPEYFSPTQSSNMNISLSKSNERPLFSQNLGPIADIKEESKQEESTSQCTGSNLTKDGKIRNQKKE